ncbi:putative aTP-binding domain protein (plasmid) [Escherichia coli]|nr:putative aTP-binding domain protein [Escherichia coli]
MKGISRVEHLLRRINEGLVDPLEADRIIPLDEDERSASMMSNRRTTCVK